jgi:hypothetical protein
MLKQRVLVLLFAVLALMLAREAPAVAQGLDGTWKAVNAQGALARLVIATDSAEGSALHAFGQCGSGECDWGSVPLTTYGKSINDAAAVAGSATFTTRFNNTMVTVWPSAPGTLLVDVFTHFTDGSGRKNYFVHEMFRQPLAGGAISPVVGRNTSARPTFILKSPSPPAQPSTPTPSTSTGSNPAGTRTILSDGSVEITYADGTKKIFGEYGVTTITPDGKQSNKPHQTTHLDAQSPTPPSVPDTETSKWAAEEASTLLVLIKTLVSNDQASIDNLLAKEAQMAWYEKINDRTTLLQTLASP